MSCAVHCLPRDFLVAVLDSMLTMRPPLEIDDLTDYLATSSLQARSVIDQLDPLSGSGTESIVRYRLRRAHITVRSQVQIPGVGRVDLLVGDRLIIECDSEQYRSGDQRRADYRRDRAATVGGYRIMRVDYREVLFQWDEVFAQILSLVRMQRHRGAPDF